MPLFLPGTAEPTCTEGDAIATSPGVSAAKPRRPMLRVAPRAAAKCSSQNAPCRPQPTARALTGSPKTFSDPAAAVYGSEGWDSSPSERANVATGQSLAAWNRRGADLLSGGLISRHFSQP